MSETSASKSAHESPGASGAPETAHEPERVRISEPERIKALAHPARMAVFDYLGIRRIQGSDGATATEIAEVAGVSPSAMSYHLRTLAKAGFIEQAPGRGDGRERVWRLTMHRFDMAIEEDAPQSAKVVEREMVQVFNDQQERNFQRWLAVSDQVDPEMRKLSQLSQGQFRLTPDESEEFTSRLEKLVGEYSQKSRDRVERSGDQDDGSIVLTYVFRLFPHV